MIVCCSVPGLISLVNSTVVPMNDLKDRINKPRSLRGTPSYSYVNKLSLSLVFISSLIGLSLGFTWWRKEVRRGNFEPVSLQELAQADQEDRIRAYVENRKRLIESTRAEEDEDEMYRLGF